MSKATKVATVGQNTIYVTPTGLKYGNKGKVMPAGCVLGSMNKGEARRVRKVLRTLGRTQHAAAKRETVETIDRCVV